VYTTATLAATSNSKCDRKSYFA